MDPDDWIGRMISEYLATARSLSQQLAAAFGQSDLLEGSRNKASPRTGRTPDGLEFSFHGIGCWISDGQKSVDLDFLPGGYVDGFDAWRLHVFARENSSIIEARTQPEVQLALERLLQRGLVQPVEGSRLFRRRAMSTGPSA